MNLVLRERMDEYEERLRDFNFNWRTEDACDDVWEHHTWGDKMKEMEWRLLIEAEQIGPDALMLLRKYQTGMA